MATAWWSNRLVQLLGSYGLGARMQRGRRYARAGQLVSFDVQPGLIVAQVQGSRAVPYVVTVATTQLTDEQWAQVQDAMAARVAFLAQLLAGQIPPELETIFDLAGVALLPAQWSAVRANCSCPDWENPCKHVAAVLYVFADKLDDDPWLLLRWRGLEREAMLAQLHASKRGVGEGVVAPWWPLVPGVELPPTADHRSTWTLNDPLVALTRLGPLDVLVKSQPAGELLAPAYLALAGTA